ncbi:unnamed protein product [Dovyalis caffra]|uniref:Uncharacterized protein n=1 Tax=Dovyalis caffra TaxID=77055 RepID=A0AAV1QS56_9ROSI|nr:unnamed protein product [Dovyalis caffra]
MEPGLIEEIKGFALLFVGSCVLAQMLTRSQSCPFCRDSLKRVNSGDLWIYTSNNEVIDLSSITRQNLKRLFMYIDKLLLIVPDPVFVPYDPRYRQVEVKIRDEDREETIEPGLHLHTLRSLVPDNASLLAEVISHLKELNRKPAEADEGLLIPLNVDENQKWSCSTSPLILDKERGELVQAAVSGEKRACARSDCERLHDGFMVNSGLQSKTRNGSYSTSPMVVCNERGELVEATVRVREKRVVKREALLC